MSTAFGLMIESLVAILLLVTIGYCVLLNRRLTHLKANEQTLKTTIAELVAATEGAERAIAGLKRCDRRKYEGPSCSVASRKQVKTRCQEPRERVDRQLQRNIKWMAPRCLMERRIDPAPQAT